MVFIGAMVLFIVMGTNGMTLFISVMILIIVMGANCVNGLLLVGEGKREEDIEISTYV
jgi:hypothetical protein